MITILLKKIPQIIISDRGEANYISTMVFIFIDVLMLAFNLDLFSIICMKQQFEHCADHMTKQIQLGTPLYVTISGGASLGDFWNFDLIHISIVGRGSGVREKYWK